MKGATKLATLQRLGVAPSFSRPKVSDDNPYSESLFKTLKYCLSYPEHGFADIEEARVWVGKFVHWYINIHLHSGINWVALNALLEAEADQLCNATRYERTTGRKEPGRGHISGSSIRRRARSS